MITVMHHCQKCLDPSLRIALQLHFACCFYVEWALTFVVFCVQNGHIFVFMGILNLCTNDDQLCVILSHEISHVLLSHMVSRTLDYHFFSSYT
jgi:Zn-dependent protease with chaperone function